MRRHGVGGVAAALAAATLLVPVAGNAAPGDVRRASSAPGGVAAQGASTNAAVSADGRFVVFDSDASNIVTPDANLTPDVFVYDRTTGSIARVSVASGGAEADSGSESNTSSASPISSDGRFVVFSSAATNLVDEDDNAVRDVFVRDRTAGTTTRVSIATGGGQADGVSVDPSISAGGRYVVFESTAENLVAGDTNGVSDIFLHDRTTGATERVSVATGGAESDGASFLPSVSSDGRFVVWYSLAFNLVPDDTNLMPDVFLRDRTTGTTTRLSVSSAGVEGDDGAFNPVIDAGGSRVVFRSASSNLVAGDTNGVGDVFVRDLVAGTTTRVSTSALGAEGNASVLAPSISADGRYVGFASTATNLISGDSNAVADVFVRDLEGGALRRVSIVAAAQVTGHSVGGSVADGGAVVAFDSLAAELVAGDSNDDWDAFLAEPDVTAPAAPVINAPAEGARPTSATVTVSGTAEPRATVTAFEAGAPLASATANASGSWSMPVTLIEGHHAITARASDVAGNIGAPSAPRAFVVDLGPPVAPVIVAPAQGAALPGAVVTISGTSEPSTTVAVTEGAATIGTALTSAAGDWSMTATLAEDTHSIRARATDPADNLSPFSAVRTFSVDLTAPGAPSITLPAPGGVVGAGSVSVAGTAEPGAAVSVLEGVTVLGEAAAGSDGSWTVTATITIKGLHTLVARARDAAGNTGPPSAPRSFTVTTATPLILAPAEGRFLATATVTIAGTAEPGATVEVRRDGGTLVGTATATGGVWSLTATFGEGGHSLGAVATGTDGWVSLSSPARTFTVDLTRPASPVIAAPTEGATVSTPVTFSGSTEPFARVFVMSSGTTVASATAGASGAWIVSAAFASGTQTVTAIAEDRAGNRSEPSAPRTFTVAAVVQIVTPAEGSFQPATVLVTGTAPPGVSLVRLYAAGIEVGAATPGGGVWSLTLTLTRGVHTLTARPMVSGTLGAPSAPRTFTTDAKAPSLVLAKPAGYTVFGVVLPSDAVHGTAEELDPYDSGVASIRIQYFNLLTGAPAGETSACVSCPGDDVVFSDRPPLPPGFYHVSVQATDAVGNVSPPATMDVFLL